MSITLFRAFDVYTEKTGEQIVEVLQEYIGESCVDTLLVGFKFPPTRFYDKVIKSNYFKVVPCPLVPIFRMEVLSPVIEGKFQDDFGEDGLNRVHITMRPSFFVMLIMLVVVLLFIYSIINCIVSHAGFIEYVKNLTIPVFMYLVFWFPFAVDSKVYKRFFKKIFAKGNKVAPKQ